MIFMSQSQASKIANLKDYLFTEGQICQNVDSRDHIFEICDTDKNILGFVSLYDLKMLTQKSGDEFADYTIRNIDQSEWVLIFSHPYFQRRKPQLVSADSLKDEEDQEIFILVNGQKAGPYEKNQLLTMVNDKEILLTDMISTNGGHTWMKLYQLDQFNRRELNADDQLPGLPKRIIEQSHETVINYRPVTDAITGLAYLSNVKREKMNGSNDKTTHDTKRTGNITVENSTSPWKLLMVMSIIFIIPFLVHIKNQLNSPFKEPEQQIGEKISNKLTPVERSPAAQIPSQVGERRDLNQINDQGRNVDQFETRTLEPIRPTPRTRPSARMNRKSFMETAKFQEIQKNQDKDIGNSDDPNYYYDNTSAMELDPVRSQISKENYESAAPPREEEGPIPTNDRLFENEATN